jgi:hypothetical protein
MHKYFTKDDYMGGESMKGKKKWEKTYCTFINLQNEGNIFGVGASFEESS